MAKKKETWRQVLAGGKGESFRDWTVIQKGILLVFVVGVSLAIIDMSCGKKETPPPVNPSQKLIKE